MLLSVVTPRLTLRPALTGVVQPIDQVPVQSPRGPLPPHQDWLDAILRHYFVADPVLVLKPLRQRVKHLLLHLRLPPALPVAAPGPAVRMIHCPTAVHRD